MDEDKVGYGKPPRAHQFKKGQSGNPKGRSKRPPSVAAMLRRELNRRVTIVENGRQKTITLEEASYRQIATKAAKGDTRSIQIILSLRAALDAPADVAPDALPQDDQAVLENMTKRLRNAGEGIAS